MLIISVAYRGVKRFGKSSDVADLDGIEGFIHRDSKGE
jgi:hypothetical protein